MSSRGPAVVLLLVALAITPAWGGEAPSEPADRGERASGTDSPDDTAMRDPLRAPGERARAARAPSEQEEARFDASAWTLYSTLVSRDRRTAIINGRNVREGGRVGGATVLRIESGRVVLDYRGRRFSIQNPTPSVRSRAR